MINATKDGGPAFPRPPIGEDCGRPYGHNDGMSLRDWFAGQALAGLLAQYGADPEWTAIAAYKEADAMLAAREAEVKP